MIERPITPGGSILENELDALHHHRWWFLVLGIAMVICGTVAIGSACLTTVTVAVAWLFGFLMLGSGIAEIINSFWVGRWSGMLAHLILGVLYTLVGFMIIDQPEAAAVQLTLIIAVFLMVSGIFRIIYAISESFAGRTWVMLNGGVTFLLGLLIYKQWPSSSLWVIGLFVGIDLILNGWAWIMLSIQLQRRPARSV
jgi:uncharacterized membrane protein HdeD (DUF308 family)